MLALGEGPLPKWAQRGTRGFRDTRDTSWLESVSCHLSYPWNVLLDEISTQERCVRS